MTETSLRVKRVYLPASDDDGYRVLVDRLWPRGLRKADARIDVWLKEVAPTAALRTWWGHDPARADDFRARYGAELRDNPALGELRALVADHPVVTLLYAAHEEDVNNAVVLCDVLART